MPLLHSDSDEAMDENISELINSGRPEKQAVAIAYDVKRKAGGKGAKRRLKRPTLHHSHPFNNAAAPDNKK